MITITHQGGVGVNGWSSIERDGVRVATIERHGMTGCRIRSVHYGEELGQYRNVQSARVAAAAMRFPDAWEVYETICARVVTWRRHWKERALQPQLMAAVYDLANGSNSAQPRLIELAAEINAYAINRSHTGNSWNGYWTHSEPVYPEPPTVARLDTHIMA